MGWFLKLKSKTEKRQPAASRGGQKPSSWDPQRTLRGLQILGGGVLAVGLAVGWTATEKTLGRYAADARGVAVASDAVDLADAPDWMDDTLGQQLRHQVAHSLDANPLDRAGLRDAVRRLNENPWVEQVTQVRRRPHGRVEVLAEYRRPAAVIAGQRGYHVVDDAGVWLEGPIDRAASRWSGLPLITGVNAPPPSEGYGHPWNGSDIPAALALQNLLADEIYADQITAYDVSHRDLKDRLWLVLYTDGPAIIWGLPPGDERSVEPEAPIKLAALRDWAYKHRGRINVRGEADTVWVYTGTAQIDARPSHTTVRR